MNDKRFCRREMAWYLIGRPYNWLFKRRYDLVNAHEGSCDRVGGAVWQVGYRNAGTSPGMRVV